MKSITVKQINYITLKINSLGLDTHYPPELFEHLTKVQGIEILEIFTQDISVMLPQYFIDEMSQYRAMPEQERVALLLMIISINEAEMALADRDEVQSKIDRRNERFEATTIRRQIAKERKAYLKLHPQTEEEKLESKILAIQEKAAKEIAKEKAQLIHNNRPASDSQIDFIKKLMAQKKVTNPNLNFNDVITMVRARELIDSLLLI